MRTEKKEINIQIGKRLKTARENIEYTQETVAEILDVGVEHYRKIDPTYLVTGEKGSDFDLEMFLAKCSRQERDAFIDRMFAYMSKLMKSKFRGSHF